MLNNLREQAVQGRKGIDFDMSMCSLLALGMSMKEILKLIQSRMLQNLIEGIY